MIRTHDTNENIISNTYDAMGQETFVCKRRRSKKNHLKKLRKEIKDRMPGKLNNAIEQAKSIMNSESAGYDELILLQCKYFRVISAQKRGTLTYSAAEQEWSKIEEYFIFILNEMEVDDFNIIERS